MHKSTSFRSRSAFLALSAVIVLTLRAPVVDAAPDPASWGESSGYNALEATRVASSAPISAPESGDAGGYDALEANRVLAARQALATGELGGMQEAALANLVADADAATASSAIAPTEERITQFGRIR